MSNSQKDATSKPKADIKRNQQPLSTSPSHKGSGHHELSTKSAPDNSGKTGSHKSKSS